MKAYSYIFIGTLFFFLGGQCAFAQTQKPKWAETSYFEEGQNSYIEVVTATGWEYNNAKEKALKAIVQRRSLAVGSNAKVTLSGDAIQVDGTKDLIVKSRVLDEYYEKMPNGEYKAYLLVQTAKRPDLALDPVSITDEYPFSARVFVPGMAQIYKGSKGKGYSIIALQTLSVASIIFCESERSTNMKKAQEQPKFAKEYHGRAQNWETGRNVSIGVAAGVYIYNIIDALVAKGTPRIVISNADGRGLSFNPYISPEATGISFALHF